jgi:hypothetical protein
MRAGFYVGLVRLGLAGALLGLAACSGDANPVRDALVTTGVGAQPKPAPDFVAASRPQTIDYIPVGAAPEKTKAKTADEIKAAEAAMEKTRTANEGRAASARALGSNPAPGAPSSPRTP